MKFIIIGLGNFGGTLARELAQQGHEVIGVDKQLDLVEDLKDRLTYSVQMDATNDRSLSELPIAEAHNVIVSLGDEGDATSVAALLKQKKAQHIIIRSVSQLHQIVLQTIGIAEIINPEQSTAQQLALRLGIPKVQQVQPLGNGYLLAEIMPVLEDEEQRLEDLNLQEKHQLAPLFIRKHSAEQVHLQAILEPLQQVMHKEASVANDEQILHQKDTLLVFGREENVRRYMRKQKEKY